jgi:hypothetical protein
MWAAVIDHDRTQSRDAARSIMRFGQEFSNFSEALDECATRSEDDPEFMEIIVRIALSLQVFCFVSGLWERGSEIMHTGAASARRLGRLSTASSFLLQLISLGRRRNDPGLISRAANNLIELAETTGDPGIAGDSEIAKGQLALLQEGHLSEAKSHFESAVKLYNTARGAISPSDQAGSKEDNAPKDSHLDSDTRMLAFAFSELGHVLERQEKPGSSGKSRDGPIANAGWREYRLGLAPHRELQRSPDAE